jgi:hypothetical protein
MNLGSGPKTRSAIETGRVRREAVFSGFRAPIKAGKSSPTMRAATTKATMLAAVPMSYLKLAAVLISPAGSKRVTL